MWAQTELRLISATAKGKGVGMAGLTENGAKQESSSTSAGSWTKGIYPWNLGSACSHGWEA